MINQLRSKKYQAEIFYNIHASHCFFFQEECIALSLFIENPANVVFFSKKVAKFNIVCYWGITFLIVKLRSILQKETADLLRNNTRKMLFWKYYSSSLQCFKSSSNFCKTRRLTLNIQVVLVRNKGLRMFQELIHVVWYGLHLIVCISSILVLIKILFFQDRSEMASIWFLFVIN